MLSSKQTHVRQTVEERISQNQTSPARAELDRFLSSEAYQDQTQTSAEPVAPELSPASSPISNDQRPPIMTPNPNGPVCPPPKRNGTNRFEDMTKEEIEQRHNESVRDYPEISDLHRNEFVMLEIRRHPLFIGFIWASWLAVLILVTSAWLILTSTNVQPMLFGTSSGTNFYGFLGMVVGLVDILVIVLAYISHKVFSGNKMFVTSERVIQFKMNSLFDEQVQTIDLGSIEDVSFHQKGVMSMLFNFGTVRMSTVGDETTYALPLVKNPSKIKNEAARIIQAVKNKRQIPSPKDERPII